MLIPGTTTDFEKSKQLFHMTFSYQDGNVIHDIFANRDAWNQFAKRV